ncbi:MAG TPA: family 16 glycoside hydrolase [Candidatus Saccharimonadales bacterium]|nr:family 16 glycoside hydrolase [Candidatus Saccharimonadales bacterium]
MLKLCLLMVFALVAVRVPGEEINFDLSKDTPGKVPPGFLSLVTGEGRPTEWTIVEEQVPPVLAPLSPNARSNVAKRPVLAVQSLNLSPGHFPLLLYTNEIFFDFTFTTRFKIVGGIIDPMAGVIFRAQDENNYYVLRASQEGNLLWYRVVGGMQYEMLGIGVKIPIPKDVWEELRVECAGSSTRCYLNGRLVIPPSKPGSPTNDLAINDTTFSNGKIGFWTRADSKCCFVDARVQYSPKVPFVEVVVEEVMRRFPSIQSLKIYANKDAGPPLIIGDPDHSELGVPGTKVEADVIARGSIYYMKVKKAVEVTLPLRDRNGDIAAALKITMKSFPGETEATAVNRATVVKKLIELRIDTLHGLVE